MKIYTKTGDAGQTGLVGGSRIDKDSSRIQAIGDVDELNAAIGLARCDSAGSPLDPTLAQIQNWLFDCGAELATPPDSRFKNEAITGRQSEELEASIDAMTADLEPLRNFIVPGGCPLAAALHLARACCRRAERSVLGLHREEPVRSETRTFLNRLSDWLFVAARTANRLEGVEDIKWSSTEVR